MSILRDREYHVDVRVVAFSFAVLIGLRTAAFADPVRLTYGADLGGATMREANRSTSSGWFLAAAFGAEVGATVSRDFSITLRLFAARGGDAELVGDFNHVSSTFLGPRLEYRPHPRLEFAVGLGAGAFDEPRRLGYAVDVYAGMNAWSDGKNYVSVAVESAPTYVPHSEAQDERSLVNVALLVAYRRR